MKIVFALIALLIVCLAFPAVVAAQPSKPQLTPEYRVVEVNAVMVKVTVGKSGNQHMAYKITDATKVTLNGAPAFARELRPGMLVQVELSPDHSAALALHAKDAPAWHGHHKVG